ncbi:MAG: hypothetical protein KatS3mg111_1679 [Pirellulaceae bacterium]|nr:MAG: hypothetical protein KatS3mg111_1679 [Pirellulaceae bacterium]
MGFIDEGENLDDFVERFPEKADELAAEVPAFADAKKRVEQERAASTQLPTGIK